MTQIDFMGRVAVITGAGQGLGRSYALELARRGACLLLNDIGQTEVERTAEEVRAIGGQAAVSTASVEQGERIVEQAMDIHGRIDILVNNAGLLRNNSFLKMTEDDWDALYRVHLLGTMRVTKAAWPYMREARYGRVLLTASIAGVFGMIGAANYAAMKAGVIALAQTLAIEGEPRGIQVNAIAPMAGSRLTETIWPREVMERFTPDLVARGVMPLLHERCPATGRVFEIGGGWLSELRWQQSEGVLFPPDFTPEDVEAAWQAITRFPHERQDYRAKDYIARIEAVTGERVAF